MEIYKMQINCIGNIFDSSGYSVHTRQLANALNKLVEVKLTTMLPNMWQRDCNDQELEMIKREDKGEINLIITNPIYWRVNCYAKRNFVYLVWEGDRVPKSFIQECLNPEIEKIIVPSEHTKQALFKTLFEVMPELKIESETKGSIIQRLNGETLWQNGDYIIWDKIIVVPHGVDHNIFSVPEKQVQKDKFTLLMNKGFRNLEDRGGAQYGLKAFLEEFTDKDNVRMVFKINPAYGIPDVTKLIGQLTDKKTDLPDLAIDTSLYDYKDMPKFYQQGDVFVCPTRCESFGLPVLEAMSCGLPVIYTDYGGQSEFAIGWKIGYDLVEVKNDLLYEGIKWATPKIDELRQCMRDVFNDPINKKIAAEGAIQASKLYDWNFTAQKIKEIADDRSSPLSAQ